MSHSGGETPKLPGRMRRVSPAVAELREEMAAVQEIVDILAPMSVRARAFVLGVLANALLPDEGKGQGDKPRPPRLGERQ